VGGCNPRPIVFMKVRKTVHTSGRLLANTITPAGSLVASALLMY
jgi:hypothetical protein